jgi:hypothetical protein
VKVADGVRGLHRGDHAHLAEAGNVDGRDHLGVLDAPARGAQRCRIVGEGVAVGVEHEAVAAIADRMRRDLHAAGARLRQRGAQLIERGDQETLARRVAVGRKQRGAARSQRAVHIELHAAHAHQPLAVGAALHHGPGIFRREIKIGPQRQLAASRKTRE